MLKINCIYIFFQTQIIVGIFSALSVALHLLDRAVGGLLQQKMFPSNFNMHLCQKLFFQLLPTLGAILIYVCNCHSFGHLFNLEETMERLSVPLPVRPLLRKLAPRTQNEFDTTVEMMNGFVADLASFSGLQPHSTSIFDLSFPHTRQLTSSTLIHYNTNAQATTFNVISKRKHPSQPQPQPHSNNRSSSFQSTLQKSDFSVSDDDCNLSILYHTETSSNSSSSLSSVQSTSPTHSNQRRKKV